MKGISSSTQTLICSKKNPRRSWSLNRVLGDGNLIEGECDGDVAGVVQSDVPFRVHLPPVCPSNLTILIIMC